MQIVARGGVNGAGQRVGSGYLAGGRLVLTAAHVVAGADAVVVRRVLGPGRDAEVGALTVWIDPAATVDVAVLRLAEDGQGAEFPVGLPPLRFGRVEGRVECEAIGFPLFMLRRDAPGEHSGRRLVYRDTHHAVGEVTPWSGQYGGTLQFTVDAPREDPDPAVSPWEGMSGAAVFAGGVLVGMVCAHHRPEGANRITGTRVERWFEQAPAALAELCALLELPERDRLEPVGASGADAGRWQGCPYLGLVPYRAQDEQVFYGREEVTDRLHRRVVLERGAVDGLLVVTGPSGAGKSSLLSAGLLPALAAGRLRRHSANWPCRLMTPTGRPLQELAAILAEVTGRPAGVLLDLLAWEPERAGELVAEALARRAVADARHERLEPVDRPRLVLVVDQFEELFTRGPVGAEGRRERAAFTVALHALTVPQPAHPEVGPGVVLVAVRGDFVDRLLEFEPLVAAYEAGPFVVRPMTEAELRRAVTGPAAEAGLPVDPELVDTLVREAREQPDAQALAAGVLPLVSQVMARVWERCDGSALTMLGYERVGGLVEAVNRDATEAYARLDEATQAVTRLVFLRLTLVTGEGRVTRRRVRREELYQATAGRREEVDRLVEAFAGRRLLVVESDLVEIAHEALVQAWEMLQDWLDEDRGDHAAYGRLAADAESWQQHDEDPGYLYQGGRLAEIATAQARWAADPERHPAPEAVVTRFLDAAHTAQNERRSAEKATIRRLRRRLVATSTLAILAVTGVAVGWAALAHARRDDVAVANASAEALSRKLAADALNVDATDPYTARQLAAAAWCLSPTSGAGQVPVELVNERPGTLFAGGDGVGSVAFNSTGTVLAVVDGGDVSLWDPVTEQRIGSITDADPDASPGADFDTGATSATFNPAGTVLAVVDGDVIQLWNPITDREIGDIIAYKSIGVAFDPAGKVLASSGSDGTVQLWDPATGRGIGSPMIATAGGIENDGVSAVAFNPAGTVLATADGDGKIRLFDPATQRQIGTIAAAEGDNSVESLAFDPTGTVLAAVYADGAFRLWDPVTLRQADTAGTPTWSDIGAVAFNATGTVLAGGNSSGAIRLWNPKIGRQIGTVDGSSGVSAVAFNASGTVLVGGYDDGSVRLWNPGTLKPISAVMTAVGGGGASVSSAAFNRSGTILASGDDGGTVRLWNPVTGQPIGATMVAVPSGESRRVDAVAFNPAGTVLASAGDDGSVRLWNPATQHQIGATIVVVAPAISLAFNPSGTMLAVAAGDGSVSFWNPATARRIGAPIMVGGRFGTFLVVVNDIAFNPAGTVMATADSAGGVMLWNLSSGRRIGTEMAAAPGMPVVSNHAYSVAFDASGKALASAGGDGSVRLWDPATRRQIGSAMVGYTGITAGQVYGVAFDPVGNLLASADEDGSFRLWNPATRTQVGATIDTGSSSVLNFVTFNPSGTVVATSVNGVLTMINVRTQTQAGDLLCRSYGLPSASTWAQYEGSSVTEPQGCS